MRVGFDLDGTIVYLNSPLLHLLDCIKDLEEKRLWEESYYRGLSLRYNPRDFLHENDEGIIITGRLIDNPVVEAITQRWVAKNFPDFELIMIGGDRPTSFVTEEEWNAWNAEITERKAQAIIDNNVDVYFDDSPSIITRLRARGIVAIQLGGRL